MKQGGQAGENHTRRHTGRSGLDRRACGWSVVGPAPRVSATARPLCPDGTRRWRTYASHWRSGGSGHGCRPERNDRSAARAVAAERRRAHARRPVGRAGLLHVRPRRLQPAAGLPQARRAGLAPLEERRRVHRLPALSRHCRAGAFDGHPQFGLRHYGRIHRDLRPVSGARRLEPRRLRGNSATGA